MEGDSRWRLLVLDSPRKREHLSPLSTRVSPTHPTRNAVRLHGGRASDRRRWLALSQLTHSGGTASASPPQHPPRLRCSHPPPSPPHRLPDAILNSFSCSARSLSCRNHLRSPHTIRVYRARASLLRFSLAPAFRDHNHHIHSPPPPSPLHPLHPLYASRAFRKRLSSSESSCMHST